MHLGANARKGIVRAVEEFGSELARIGVSPKQAIEMLMRVEELCRRRRVYVQDSDHALFLRHVVHELEENAAAFEKPASYCTKFTAYNGAVAPDLLNEFPILLSSRALRSIIVTSAATDPRKRLQEVAAKYNKLAREVVAPGCFFATYGEATLVRAALAKDPLEVLNKHDREIQNRSRAEDIVRLLEKECEKPQSKIACFADDPWTFKLTSLTHPQDAVAFLETASAVYCDFLDKAEDPKSAFAKYSRETLRRAAVLSALEPSRPLPSVLWESEALLVTARDTPDRTATEDTFVNHFHNGTKTIDL